MTIRYHLTAEVPTGVPVLRAAHIVFRIGAKGEAEFRGIYATDEDARADPLAANPAAGWKVAMVPLLAWNAIELRGER